MYIQLVPVIQPGALQFPVVNRKAQRADKVQGSACGGAGAGDVAGVLRYLRLMKNDMYAGHGVFLSVGASAPL